MFNISIKENILLGKKVHPARQVKILKGLRIHNFITNLEVIYGDSGTNLSAGQLQRIRLARGVMQDSEIYLLDEPFNGIDKENKDRIITFLKEFFHNKTVIIISHHKDELRFFDQIFEMQNGILKRV